MPPSLLPSERFPRLRSLLVRGAYTIRTVSPLYYERAKGENGNETYETRSKLCGSRQEFVLEVLNHSLHAAIQDVKVRLVGQLQQVCELMSTHFNTSCTTGANLGLLCRLEEQLQP